jgi:hypothetical protein
MALEKDVNAYATVEEADAYFADRLDSENWTQATPLRRAQALVTATLILEAFSWLGVVRNSGQALAHPRTGNFFNIKSGLLEELPETTPDGVVKGSFELAIHMLGNEGLREDSGQIKNLTVDGTATLQNILKPALIPAAVKTLIRPYLTNGNAKTWWRSN